MAGWLQVDEERILGLGDDELRVFMRELLWAAARRAGCDVSKLTLNSRTKAKDKGCDGLTPPPPSSDAWLKDATVCWQLKAGEAGRPSKLNGEVKKEIPQQILRDGGWLIVVASGCSNGEAGRLDREAVLKKEAEALGLPTDRIRVYSADQLAQWASEHPAVATLLYDVAQADILTHDAWLGLKAHQVPFTAAGRISNELVDLCEHFLDHPYSPREPRLAYIAGEHGSGKTRFALEAAARSTAKHSTVYIPSATREILSDIATYLLNNSRATLTLIADDVLADPHALGVIQMAAERLEGRFRALVITHHAHDALVEGVLRFDRSTSTEELNSIVSGWFPGMARERIAFVVAVAERNVRLARLVAEAVDRGEITTASDVFERKDASSLMDKLLGGENKALLSVAAVGDSIGWEGPAEAEGRMVAEYFGLNWGEVRGAVQAAHDRLGIAPLARYRRYITPGPLGLYLASFAWKAYPGSMRTLARDLPEPGRERLLERFKELGSNPSTVELAREEVEQLRALDDFRDEAATRLFRAIAAVQPGIATQRLRAVLSTASPDEVMSLRGGARRDLIWELERLSWPRDTFEDAVVSLAILASSENETYANNATSVFLGRFHVFLGGTSVPYVERLPVLAELWGEDRPGMRELVLQALTCVMNDHHMRSDTGLSRTRVVEPEWQPGTGREHFAAVEAALDAVMRYLGTASVGDFADELLATIAEKFLPLQRVPELKDRCLALVERVLELSGAARETLRKAVRRHMHWLEIREESSEEGEAGRVAELELYRAMHDRLSDPSLMGRLREVVGEESFLDHGEPNPKLVDLAVEVRERSGALDSAEADWLFGGDANRAWDFGKALGAADAEGALLESIWKKTLVGTDSRLLSGYLFSQREQRGQDWLDSFLDAREAEAPDAVFELTLRSGPDGRGLERIRDLLSRQVVSDRLVGMLEYGWILKDAPAEKFVMILEQLLQQERWRGIGVSIASHHLKDRDDLRSDEGVQRIVLLLLSDSGVLTSRRSSSGDYWWTQLALSYVDEHASLLAATLFDAHLGRGEDTHAWFLEHSQARDVLAAAMRAHPEEVWPLLADKLEFTGFRFTIGFPEGIIELAPRRAVLDWLAEAPEERVPLVARIAALRFDSDDGLAMQVLEKFGQQERVAAAFTMALGSGSWVGELSAKYDGLSTSLTDCAARTQLPNARAWLRKAAEDMRDQAAREREREAEERLLWG